MNTNGKYLKDENGNIFSPVISGDTVFYDNTHSINDFVGNFYLDYQSDISGLLSFNGTKSDAKGGCQLPNGLIFNWGAENSGSFTADGNYGNGYSKDITFLYPYKHSCVCIASFKYVNGMDVVGCGVTTTTKVKLVSQAKVNGFYVQYICIGC